MWFVHSFGLVVLKLGSTGFLKRYCRTSLTNYKTRLLLFGNDGLSLVMTTLYKDESKDGPRGHFKVYYRAICKIEELVKVEKYLHCYSCKTYTLMRDCCQARECYENVTRVLSCYLIIPITNWYQIRPIPIYACRQFICPSQEWIVGSRLLGIIMILSPTTHGNNWLLGRYFLT